MNPTHLDFKPNNYENGFDPTQPTSTLEPNTPNVADGDERGVERRMSETNRERMTFGYAREVRAVPMLRS